MSYAIGYISEYDEGAVCEIGNDAVSRRLLIVGGKLSTVSLTNMINGEEYSDFAEGEFEITLCAHPGGDTTYTDRDFTVTGTKLSGDDSAKRLEIDLESPVLRVMLTYEAEAGKSFITKSITLKSALPENTHVESLVTESITLAETLEGVSLSADTSKRFDYGAGFDNVVEAVFLREGLFAFQASPGGKEIYENNTLIMGEEVHHMNFGDESGKAVIGAFAGDTERGFRALREYLRDFYSVCGTGNRDCVVSPERNAHLLSAAGYMAPCEKPATDPLTARQIMYGAAFILPAKAIMRVWEPSGTPETLSEYIFERMSVMACRFDEDLLPPKPEFDDFAMRYNTFMGRFREFFENYDHILSYPDGSRPDGSAHFIGNRGFFVLINPTDSEQSVTLPLNEKSLALSAGEVYKLTDFTSLTTPVPMDNATLTAPPTIDLIPREVRIIGVNI